MDICQLAVSCLKWVRLDLMKEQRNVRVYTPLGLQNSCYLSQLVSTCLLYIVPSFRWVAVVRPCAKFKGGETQQSRFTRFGTPPGVTLRSASAINRHLTLDADVAQIYGNIKH